MAPGGLGPAVSSSDAECLFSLEFVVHRVKVDNASLGERPLPVVAFRLLEFPTVLLYPRPGCSDGVEQSESSPGILHLSFDRGKSCLFRQSLLSLHRLLSRVPLYILLLDMSARAPLLLGSCSLSLLHAVTLLRDGNVGVPVPCWRGESGEHPLIDLMGRNVGTISLAYRLLCLGGSVVGHMGLISGQTEQITTRQVAMTSSADPAAEDKPWLSSPKQGASAETQKEQVPPLSNDQTVTTGVDVEESLADKALPGPTHQQNQPALPMPTPLRIKQLLDLDLQAELEQETNVHCPPLLYYTSDNDHKAANEKLHDGIVVEANESNAGEHKGGHLQLADKRMTKPKTKKDKVRNTQQKVLGDICPEPILSQLPLLNALLHELSLLNGQLPLSEEAISSSLARQYKKGTSFEMGQTMSSPLEKSRRKSPPKLKRNKEESFSRPPCAENHERNKQRVKVKPNLTKAEVSSKRKLLYGLTNTFRLRLQQINPSGLQEHERRERYRREQLELLQQNKSRHKGLLSKTRRPQSASGWASKAHKIPGHHHGSLDENIETLIQSNKTNTREHFSTRQDHQKTPSSKVYDSRGKPASKPLSQPDRSLKINLPQSSIQSLEVGEQEDKPNLPKFPGSCLSGTYKPDSRSSLNSPNGEMSQDLLESQDYMGYSDDFTSVDFTARNSDAFDSSPEPGPRREFIHSNSERSVSSSKYNSATPSFTTPQPTASNVSPVQSYETAMKYKKYPEIKIPLDVYDDISEDHIGNEEERSKPADASSTDSEPQRQRDNSPFGDPSESEPYSYDHSGWASKVDMPTNRSNGDLSALDFSSTLHFKTDTSDHKDMVTHNQYEHISELQLKALSA